MYKSDSYELLSGIIKCGSGCTDCVMAILTMQFVMRRKCFGVAKMPTASATSVKSDKLRADSAKDRNTKWSIPSHRVNLCLKGHGTFRSRKDSRIIHLPRFQHSLRFIPTCQPYRLSAIHIILAMPVICILGATGTQGGSVCKALLQNPKWQVRGLSRNINGESAKLLASQVCILEQ